LTAELGAAGLLLAAPWVGGAGFAPAAVLFAIYALAVAINLARGRTEIDCGCGWGERGAGITRLHAGRPLALAFAAFVGAVGAPAAAPSAAVVAGALLLAAPFVVVYLAADVLIENDARLAAGR
ncbi:MAG: MauE/DoxX family redox-associated membrane protein, partial [Pseudomonadota bacterium]